MSVAKRILVVEDSDELREALMDVLRGGGYAVTGAANGRLAFEALAEMDGVPSLILLDLMMPEMDGWQFMDALRARPALANIPIIALSAAGESIPNKPMFFLRKPVSTQTLISVVAKVA